MTVPKLALALVAALALPAAATAATPDAPGGAIDFSVITAENGTPTEREAVLRLDATGPDAGVPRCLGAGSFEHTAWAWIPATTDDQYVVVEATPKDDQAGTSTQTPDLALFPQEPVMRQTADLSAPALCDGRETLGDGARSDGSAAVTALLRAGLLALVQVGWRGGDALAPVVLSLRTVARERAARPAGDDPATAPQLPAASAAAVELAGATVGLGDPATPWCAAPATVWRRIAVPAPGSYAVAAAGAADTLAVFGAAPAFGTEAGCADRADTPELGVVAATAGHELWVRVGTDQLGGQPVAQLTSAGPFTSPAAAQAALPSLQAAAPAASCTGARVPKLATDGDALRKLRQGRSRRLSGTLLQPCSAQAPQARRVMVAVARRSGNRCRWLSGRRWSAKRTSCRSPRHARRAVGITRWQRTLPRRLATGRYVVAVRVVSRAPGAARTATSSTTRHAFRITSPKR